MSEKLRSVPRLLNTYNNNVQQKQMAKPFSEAEMEEFLTNPQPYLAQIKASQREISQDLKEKAARIFYYKSHNRDVFNMIDKFAKEVTSQAENDTLKRERRKKYQDFQQNRAMAHAALVERSKQSKLKSKAIKNFNKRRLKAVNSQTYKEIQENTLKLNKQRNDHRRRLLRENQRKVYKRKEEYELGRDKLEQLKLIRHHGYKEQYLREIGQQIAKRSKQKQQWKQIGVIEKEWSKKYDQIKKVQKIAMDSMSYILDEPNKSVQLQKLANLKEQVLVDTSKILSPVMSSKRSSQSMNRSRSRVGKSMSISIHPMDKDNFYDNLTPLAKTGLDSQIITPKVKSLKPFYIPNRSTDQMWLKHGRKPNIKIYDNKYQTSSTVALDYLMKRNKYKPRQNYRDNQSQLSSQAQTSKSSQFTQKRKSLK